jgi:hypothetical protein
VIKKKNNNDFVFFKYYTDDGKRDDEESEDSVSDCQENEDCRCKDLLLKKIELMFQNGYSYTDIEKFFPTFYEANIKRINLLCTEVLAERFKRDPTLMVEKDIDIYRTRQDQIEIIEKRRILQKVIKKLERKKEDKKTIAFVVTNGIKQKKISTLHSTMKSKMRNNKNQLKESLKEMILLKSIKTKSKTKIQKKFSDKSEKLDPRSSSEILMMTVK